MTKPEKVKKKWSPADFLDRAQELKRRLEVWHIQGAEPVFAPRDIVLIMEESQKVFRDRVMLGEHNPNPSFASYMIVEDRFVQRYQDPYLKFVTVWEFRDFVEHLASDAGNSEEAKLVRLKVERLLDAPMYKRARNELFGDHIVGREVESHLLSEFEDAVRVFSIGHTAKNDEGSGKPKKGQWFGLAVMELRNDPSITDAELARRVKVHPGTISRSKKLRELRESIRGAGIGIKSGSKYDGIIEAIDD